MLLLARWPCSVPEAAVRVPPKGSRALGVLLSSSNKRRLGGPLGEEEPGAGVRIPLVPSCKFLQAEQPSTEKSLLSPRQLTQQGASPGSRNLSLA